MAIRSAAKALIVRDGEILLNRCVNESGHVHYDLPGGGQHQYETLEEAVVRECLEETGYRVEVVRFAALAEEIYDDEVLRERYPDYTHRMHHIFLAEILGGAPDKATETDFHQVASQWVAVSRVGELDIRPAQLREDIERVLSSDTPVYLGAVCKFGVIALVFIRHPRVPGRSAYEMKRSSPLGASSQAVYTRR